MAKKCPESKKRYVVQVSFYNIDMENTWKKNFVLSKKPTKKWMSKLYDGVSEPQRFRVLGTLCRRK